MYQQCQCRTFSSQIAGTRVVLTMAQYSKGGFMRDMTIVPMQSKRPTSLSSHDSLTWMSVSFNTVVG